MKTAPGILFILLNVMCKDDPSTLLRGVFPETSLLREISFEKRVPSNRFSSQHLNSLSQGENIMTRPKHTKSFLTIPNENL
jgi:hypothetical protein